MTKRTLALLLVLSSPAAGCGWLFPGGDAASVTIVDGALEGDVGPARADVAAIVPVATEEAYRTHVLYATSDAGFAIEVELEIDALETLPVGTELVHAVEAPEPRIALRAAATTQDGAPTIELLASTLRVTIEEHPTDVALRRARFEATHVHDGTTQTVRGFFDYELPRDDPSSDSDADWDIDEWD